MQSVEMSPSADAPVPWYFQGSTPPSKRAKDGHELDVSPGSPPAVANPPGRLVNNVLAGAPVCRGILWRPYDGRPELLNTPDEIKSALVGINANIAGAQADISRVESQKAKFQQEREECMKDEKAADLNSARNRKRSAVCFGHVERKSQFIAGKKGDILTWSAQRDVLKRKLDRLNLERFNQFEQSNTVRRRVE